MAWCRTPNTPLCEQMMAQFTGVHICHPGNELTFFVLNFFEEWEIG